MQDSLTPILETQHAALMQVNNAFETVSITMNSFQWVSPPDVEFFANSDLEKFQQEMNTINEILTKIAESQLVISEQAANMNILPPNASTLNTTLQNMEQSININTKAQQNFNVEISKSEKEASKLKQILSGVFNMSNAKSVVKWLQQSVNLTNEKLRIENQLATVMRNRGATYEEFVRLQEISKRIQADTNGMISSSTMMGAANELAQHVGNIDAIEIMMDSLADFAAGAGNVFGATAESMAAHARYFTQAMAGNYRMLEQRAGISLTETQKQVIRYGNDMQRALMIQDIVGASWEGAADRMAQTPEGMRVGMINAFNSIRSSIGAQLLPMLMILFTTIQEHMPQIEAILHSLLPPIQFLIGLLGQIINIVFGVYDVISSNWGMIAPIIWGIVAAFAAWKLATMILAIKKWILTTAIWAKTAALLANPLMWIVVLIGTLVTAIMAWINHIGGLRIAWLYVVNALKTTWDALQIGFHTGIHFVMDLWDRFKLKTMEIAVAIANSIGNMRVNVLMILENMINSSMNMINRFIERLNRLPFVNINTIEQVSFGVTAAAENEAAQQARNAALNRYRAGIEAGIAERAAIREQMVTDAHTAMTDRLAEIHELRAAAAEEAYAPTTNPWDTDPSFFYGNDGFGSLGRDVSDISSNTGAIASITGENLKYWRDIAERDSINRFTTAKVDVRIAGITNNVNNEMDLDDVIDYIVDGVEEGIETTAERCEVYV